MSAAAVAVPKRSKSSFELALKLHEGLGALRRLGDVRQVLRLFVEHFDAFGAALWEVADEVGKDRGGRLFIQAHYFQTDGKEWDLPPFFHLPNDSISGRCIHRDKPVLHARADGCWTIPVSHPGVSQELEVESFASVPVKLNPGSKASDATITFYSRGRAFESDEFQSMCDAARLFPAVYQAIRESASFDLIHQVQACLRARPFPVDQPEQGRAQAEKAMDAVIAIVAQQCQFEEVTVILHNPSQDSPGKYARIAEKWPWKTASPDTYELGRGETGWVLEKGKPLRILDMARFEEDRKYYEETYPGLRWIDRPGMVQESKELFGSQKDEVLPMSYACVPILRHDNGVHGALRCCISRRGPYHVDKDVLQTLESAATHIGHWWDHWVRAEQEHHDKAAANSAMAQLGAANRFMITRFSQFEVHHEIASEILRVCQKSVPQATIYELWLQYRQNQPFVRSVRGPRQIDMHLRELMDQAAHTAIRQQVPTHKPQEHGKPGASTRFSYTVSPIIVAGMSRGALALAADQSVKQVPWPNTISLVATFLADQLALYVSFSEQAREQAETSRKLQNTMKEHSNLLMDFKHQLRSPLKIAVNSVESLRECFPASERSNESFEVLESSVFRARRVANNLQQFVDLAQGNTISARTEKILVQDALDHIQHAFKFLYTKRALGRQTAKIQVTPAQPQGTQVPELFWGDRNVLELIVDNLLDNAIKYGYPDEAIKVFPDSADYGRKLSLVFRNRGLAITPEEAKRFLSRGERGDAAKTVSPEGTGIGLWMVNQAMRSMGGHVEVLPTDREGWNEIRLTFQAVVK